MFICSIRVRIRDDCICHASDEQHVFVFVCSWPKSFEHMTLGTAVSELKLQFTV